METLWLEYAWTLLILIGLEGLLSADNALVLAVIAKHLPENQKRRAINYGIIVAFVFTICCTFCHFFYCERLAGTGDRSSLSSLLRFKACHSSTIRERKGEPS